MSTVVQLSKEQNERLQDKRDSLTKRYHDLYQDYIVLKYGDLCQQCQTTSNENTLVSLRRELIKKDQEIRYWQECYDTLLKHELSFNGIQSTFALFSR